MTTHPGTEALSERLRARLRYLSASVCRRRLQTMKSLVDRQICRAAGGAGENLLETRVVGRLRQVRVEPGIEGGLDVAVLAVTAERDEPHVLVLGIGPYPPGELESAHHRESEIDQGEVGPDR